MKKLFFVLMLFLNTFNASAYDYPYLTFQKTDGSVVDLSVENLVLTVSGNSIVASDGSTSTTLTIADLTKMYFSTSSTSGIAETSLSGDSEPVEIFTMSGVSLGSYDNIATAKKNLQKGLFLVKEKSNGSSKTYKIEVK